MKMRTLSVHTGVAKDRSYNSVITPIYPSSTFSFDAIGKNRGYDYTRSGNPTRTALEENIAALEGGVGCSATATGMAAITSIMFYFKPGDHIIAGDDIYGGTYRLFNAVMSGMGLSFSFVNMRDLSAIRSALRPETRLIWIETPSNPLLNITDIGAVTGLARERGIMTIADNNLPFALLPASLRARGGCHRPFDYQVHKRPQRCRRGAIVYSTKELEERGRYLVNALGTSEAPFDCWLALRGVKTLSQRMEAHQENAMKIAEHLERHPRIKRVYYPGLASHPQGELIRRQMKGFGGMLAFNLDTSKVSMDRFFSRLKLFTLAESLGGWNRSWRSPGS